MPDENHSTRNGLEIGSESHLISTRINQLKHTGGNVICRPRFISNANLLGECSYSGRVVNTGWVLSGWDVISQSSSPGTKSSNKNGDNNVGTVVRMSFPKCLLVSWRIYKGDMGEGAKSAIRSAI
ncbi:MAG: hypothetical protein ABFD08_09290 [Syntrophomonas sp.]